MTNTLRFSKSHSLNDNYILNRNTVKTVTVINVETGDCFMPGVYQINSMFSSAELDI